MLVGSNKYIHYLALYKAYNTIPNAVIPTARQLLIAATIYIEKFVNKDDESNKAVTTLTTLVEI
jgi:hypothetical protein